MKVVVVRHPNTQCREITSTVRICEKHFSLYEVDSLPEKLKQLMIDVGNVNLVTEVYISKYSLNFQIEDSFKEHDDLWDEVETKINKIFFDFLGVTPEDVQFSIDDRRSKKLSPYHPDFESDRIEDYTVNITGLKRFVDKITIPHDFETHRLAWRAALEKMHALTKTFTGDNEEHITKDDDALYWEHEIKAFDAAFEKLLALRLPQDA